MFGVQDEWAYLYDLRHSTFSLTKRRGGCDSLRHYEILAHSAIPYFFDFLLCPNMTAATLPRRILADELFLLETLKDNKYATWSHMDAPINILGITKFRRGKFRFFENGRTTFVARERSVIETMRSKLKQYTQQYLTTASLAKYILSRSNADNGVILILCETEDNVDDFMQNAIVHGMRALYGDRVLVYPYVYRWYTLPSSTTLDELEYQRDLHFTKQHGKGMTFGFRARRHSQSSEFDEGLSAENISRILESKRVGLVVYPRLIHKKPIQKKRFLSEVLRMNVPVVFVDGNDAHQDPCPELLELGNIPRSTIFR
eukprot:PhF_6_TR10239/c0_g1_i3/m.15873